MFRNKEHNKITLFDLYQYTHTHRHQLMITVDGLGWTTKTTVLNNNNILKPWIQTPYIQKDVWMSKMKLKKRE